ncbi:hypothetical protein [Planomonospora sp. ID82291]|uniref:hypothetical protein n=1 Tax=Planomonospora sp. ID82291 TaxID=2738136 RepID=UPI0018C42145|nr:hypothetical protein [Planomonospora sp. ID82291]MBG0818688.1 hypothetical protein [Planomonospora sp. ID82291]
MADHRARKVLAAHVLGHDEDLQPALERADVVITPSAIVQRQALEQVAVLLGGTDTCQEITHLLTTIGLHSTLGRVGYQPHDISGFIAHITGNVDNDPHPEVTTDLIAGIYHDSL